MPGLGLAQPAEEGTGVEERRSLPGSSARFWLPPALKNTDRPLPRRLCSCDNAHDALTNPKGEWKASAC